jgi:hypothetical protein
MNDATDPELIELYLLGKMTDQETRSFETRLDDDRELRRKLRLIRTFPEMMSERGRMEYEKNLAQATAKVVRKKNFRYPNRRYLVWAAVVLFLAGAAVAIFFIFKGNGHKDENGIQNENVIPKTNIQTESAPVKDTAGTKPQLQPEKKITSVVTLDAEQKAIELLKPADGMKFTRKDIILFDWIQKTDSFTRFYIVSELHDQVVFWRGIRLGIREYKVPGDYLYPGVYYWYVGTKDEKRTFIVTE